jgi:hypothetical protein
MEKIKITIKGSRSEKFVQEFINLEDTSLESAIIFEGEKRENGETRIPEPEFLAAYSIVVKKYGITDLSTKNINYYLCHEGRKFADLVSAFKTIKYISTP